MYIEISQVTNECEAMPGIKESMVRHCLNRLEVKIVKDTVLKREVEV